MLLSMDSCSSLKHEASLALCRGRVPSVKGLLRAQETMES